MVKLKWGSKDLKTGLPYGLEVIREKGDPVFYGAYKGAGESQFLHWLKLVLIKKYKWDLIKKLMWKDDHMVDDTQHYLRSRYQTTKPNIAIYNNHYAITDLNDDFRTNGYASLEVTTAWEPIEKKPTKKR